MSTSPPSSYRDNYALTRRPSGRDGGGTPIGKIRDRSIGFATVSADANRTGLPTSGAQWACVADLNGDGWKDIVFADYYDQSTGYAANSYIYWNASGVFSPTNRTAVPTNGAAHCAIDDLNADGRPDIVFANYYGGAYATNSYVYFNSSTGFSTSNRTDLPTVGTYGLSIADLDNDGRKDIVFWSHYDGTQHYTQFNYIYWNSPSGYSIGSRTAFESYGGYQGSIADLNGDGNLDVIPSGYYNAAWTNLVPQYIYWGDGTRNYSNTRRTTLTSRGILTNLVDDIDGDGNLDILMGSHYDGDSFTTSMVFWGSPGGGYNDANRTDYPNYQGVYNLAVVDINHDGYKDIFIPGYHNNGWANMAYSRIYWGNASGRPNNASFTEFPSRGAWAAQVVGK